MTAAPALVCADLIPLPDLQAAITTPLSVKIDEQSAPRGSADAIFLQAGGVHCVWGGENRTDQSWDQGLDVRILPATLDDVDMILAATTFYEGAVFDTIGERSGLGCYSGEYWDCSAVAFVGDRIISARMSDAGATTDPVALAQGVLQQVGAAIELTTPNAPIAPEPNSFDGGSVCEDPTVVAAAFEAAPGDVHLRPFDSYFSLDAIAAREITSVGCPWLVGADLQTGQPFNITVIPGAGWQFERMVAQPDEVGGVLLGTASPFPVEGTEGALVACGDGCWAGLLYQGSLIELYAGNTYDASEMQAIVVRFVAALT